MIDGYFKKRAETGYYEVLVKKIQDCNHLKVDVIGFNMVLMNKKVRLYGVKCHEWRSKDPFEKASADLAMMEIKKWVKLGGKYLAYLQGNERPQIQLFVDGEITLNEKLLSGGFGQYFQQKVV